MASHLRRPFPAVLLLIGLAAVLALAACGGDDEGKDATATLDKAFKQTIKSADMTLDLEAKVDGVEQLKDPIKVKLSGPYVNNGDAKLPSLDWDLSVSAGGTNFTAGLISTGDNAYVSFQGQNYEVGAKTVQAVNRQLASQAKRGEKNDLSSFGVNPRNWLQEPKDEGTEDVAGTESTHITTGLDVRKFVEDLNTIIEKAPNRLAQGQRPPKLTDKQIEQVEDVVKDPKFDVYVGEDDDKLRRISADLEIEVPEDQRRAVGGVEGGTLSFSIEFANVDGDQTVDAPRDAKPISDLTDQLGGLLGGAGGGALAPGGSGGSGGSGGPGGAGTKGLEDYSKCIQEADAQDAAELQKCAELLR